MAEGPIHLGSNSVSVFGERRLLNFFARRVSCDLFRYILGAILVTSRFLAGGAGLNFLSPRLFSRLFPAFHDAGRFDPVPQQSGGLLSFWLVSTVPVVRRPL